jgi:ATP-binding cassette subfamily B protein
VLYSRKFAGPINAVAEIFNELFSALAASERVFTLLDEEEEGADIPDARILENVRGDISAEHVSFGYEPGKTILHDLNLEAPAGKLIAIVGPTGAGKTTIINLLMRFYEIDSGQILLDGKDIRGISTDELRDAVGIVLQDTVLFTDTVRNNLTYADEGAPQEEIDRAARMSRCDDVVAHLPEGYETVLESSGANLSQGQRQLLTIGRAFLSDPSILILDEATSSVDTRTEMDIQDAMANLMRDRTSLIIAHRLSTIQDADEIIVMDHGAIVESGKHEELLAKKGRYHDLYMTQFAGQET